MKDQITEGTLMILFAAIGGAVHYLYSMKGFSFIRLIIGMVVAGFTGFIVYLVLGCYGMEDGMRSALVGISGFTSNDLLKLIEKKFLNRVNKMVD